jgi:hypothetical protein
MPTKSGKYVYLEDGSNAEQVYVANPGDTNSIMPIDIQSRYAQTIQTHNAVSVATTATSASSWIDCDGFDKIAGTLKNDATTTSNITIDWSNDGATVHGTENIIVNGTGTTRAGIQDVKARYARISVYNGDTVSHTMSAWIYLKA